MNAQTPSFERLLELLRTLRSASGCPWTRSQDFGSLRAFLQEEVYETLETLDVVVEEEKNGARIQEPTAGALCEELGDLLLEFGFLAVLAEEKGYFRIDDILEGICAKIVRRHPHVFGERQAHSPAEVARLWEEVKAQEKKIKRDKSPDSGALSGVPRRLPALARAQKVGEKAAANGFDWPDRQGVLDKVQEEMNELTEVIQSQDDSPETQQKRTHELGDLFFALTNLARFLRLSSEEALHRGVDRFQGRFQAMEQLMRERRQEFSSIARNDLEALWLEVKRLEQAAGARPTDRK